MIHRLKRVPIEFKCFFILSSVIGAWVYYVLVAM